MARPSNWPTTITDLAKRMMVLLGEIEVFTDITTDTSDNAVLVRTVIYDIILDTQTAFLWPELHTMETIETPDATFDDTTGYDFSYRYDLPDDYLRPLNEELYDYRIIGKQVYSNTSENLPFHYIKYDETVTNWSGSLYRAILYRLAIAVCLQITQSEIVYERLLAEYEKIIEPECFRIRSYSQEHPNTRRRIRGTYSKTRRGYRY